MAARHFSALILVSLALALAPAGSGCRSASAPPPTQPDVAVPTDTDPPSVGGAGDAGALGSGTEPMPVPEEVPIGEVAAGEEQPAEEPAAQAPPLEPEALQQEALDLVQSASEFLNRGELDDALASLDRAYELMLALPSDGEESWLQAREDIRRLVAELIVTTYESRQTAAAEPATSWDLALPLVENEHVEREIRSFTNGERQFFLDSYRRSGRYRPMILAKLQAAGLPSQLSWLPLVESGFKVRALSRASALGLWQFIASTGQRYGLARDGWVDQRMDPDRATDAALAYLSELHGMFGDWPKALAAYNCGEARLLRLSRRQPEVYVDFWDLYLMLPQETRRYVPRFFATLRILEDPARFGIELPEVDAPGTSWMPVSVSRSVELKRLEDALGLEAGVLASLNPELRHAATPPREYQLKVPVGLSEQAAEVVVQLPEWSPPQPATVTHRVRRGETLSAIAARYGTSVSAIMRSNNLRSANRIWPGQRLEVPVRGARAPAGPSYNPSTGTHTVRPGDSLYSIARRYSTTVEELRAANRLTSNTIYPGQNLTVRPGSRSDLRRYQVQRGDTLSTIADRHGVGLSALLRANGISSRTTIYPGQWLVIPS